MQNKGHAESMEKAMEVAGKAYHPEHTDNDEELTITHEQVVNTYQDGTIDIKHNGKDN